MSITTTPDILLIGHICHDKMPNGTLTLGGAAAYGGLFAARLGCHVATLTSWGPDFQFYDQLDEMDLSVVPATHTTIFENIYENGQRTQFIHARAADLMPSQLPPAWLAAKTVILCPIADEVSFDFVGFFKQAVVCACPQGWMRQWGHDKKIFPKQLGKWELLSQLPILCMSENDVACDWDLIKKIGSMAKLLVVTQGAKGATVFQQGSERYFPSFPTNEVDPTGAGDVFAVAFTLKYAQSGALGEAVAFAHAAASLHVEQPGMEAVPGLSAVETRQGAYVQLLMNAN